MPGTGHLRRTKDAVDTSDNHEGRIQALESGAHPIRFDWGPGITTPWFTLEPLGAFEGPVYWRVARAITQLRGILTGPTDWADGVAAFDLPADILPAWPLKLVTPHTNGAMCIVEINTNGTAYLYRGPGGDDDLILDNIQFPRG